MSRRRWLGHATAVLLCLGPFGLGSQALGAGGSVNAKACSDGTHLFWGDTSNLGFTLFPVGFVNGHPCEVGRLKMKIPPHTLDLAFSGESTAIVTGRGTEQVCMLTERGKAWFVPIRGTFTLKLNDRGEEGDRVDISFIPALGDRYAPLARRHYTLVVKQGRLVIRRPE